ncbi:MAG: DUF6624 domain-containing protein [Bacteroidota bacterium]
MKYLLFLSLMLALVACNTTADKPTEITKTIDYEALKAELETIHETDQKYRLQITQSKTFDAELVAKMNQTDSINQIRMIEILDEYGWLPKSKIGETAADALFLVIQHSPKTVMRKYMDELKAQAKAGEASKMHAAMMEDRLLMYEGKKQIYGSQATSYMDGTQGYFIWPIKETATVNARRKVAGFSNTIEEYAESMGATYDPNESLPDETLF